MAGGVVTDASHPETPRYHAIDGAEWLDNYMPGGYHPVMPGDYVHNKRYRITHKLGHGCYSTVWLVRDAQAAKYRALKINAARISTEVQREISILRELKPKYIVPEVIDDFEIQGPNGVHTCYTMQIAANSLAEAKQHDTFPIDVARALAAKLASLIEALHSHGFCHGDLRLANVLIKPDGDLGEYDNQLLAQTLGPPAVQPIERLDGQPLTTHVPPSICMPVHLSKPTKLFTVRDAQSIVLSDFGKAFRPEHPNRWPCLGRDSGVPLNARAPEALFEPELPISFASDIWSLACAIWHLLGSSAGLFSTVEVRTDSMVADVLGALDGLDDLPRAWRRQWDRPDDLAHEIHSPVQTPMSSSPPLPKRPHDIDEHPPPTLRSLFELHVQQPRRQLGNPFEDDEVEAILALFRGMLKLDPKERWTIQQVLESEWMRKWTLPVLNTRVKSERGTFQKNYPTCERKNFEGKGLSSC